MQNPVCLGVIVESVSAVHCYQKSIIVSATRTLMPTARSATTTASSSSMEHSNVAALKIKACEPGINIPKYSEQELKRDLPRLS